MMPCLLRPLVLVFGLFALLLPGTARAEKLALVIGMGAYAHIVPLDNSVNDARGIAKVLEQNDFEVMLSIDAPLAELTDTLADFSFRAETADLALVYFAGHGVEVQGQNFLIPVDADVKSNLEVQAASVSLADFELAVGKARRMGMVLLDSCRDNPFADNIALAEESGEGRIGGTRSAAGSSGLAPADPDRGTVVFFAARHGQAALDGVDGHSPFARALIDKLGEPGLEIGVMLRQVRDEVMKNTGNLQEPFSYGSLPGTPFYVAGARDGEEDVSLVADRSSGWAELGTDQEELLVAQAETGDTRSLLGLGYIRLNAADPAFDPASARQYFERAAAAGSPEAQFELARLLELGVGGPADPARALDLYRMSAEQGYGNALNELGFIHFQGLYGLPSDPATGIHYFTLAAKERDPEAQYNLAALIDDGLVADKGPQDAAHLLYEALRSGNERVLSVASQMGEQFELETRRALQEELQANGFYDGKIDGDIGPGTATAMRRAFGIEDA
jgi:TPR repeat protein